MRQINKKLSGVKINSTDLCKGRLRKSLAILTYLIERGSDDLWPIFEKLEGELVKLEQRQNRLLRYHDYKRIE